MASKSEHAFIDKVPEEYNCSICTNVLDEPVLIECCGQHFCKNCLENWFEKGPGQKKNKTCPTCRSEDIAFIKSLHLKRKISNLKIYCPNHTEGCGEQLSIGALEAHLATCNFVYVECRNTCGVAMLRKDLKLHLQNYCLKRLVGCQLCGSVGLYQVVTGSHLNECPDLLLVCQRCGATGIKRKNMEFHKQKCPQEPVQCPFYEAGCKEELLRKDLEVHTASSTQQHLQLIMITTTNNKAQLNTVKKEHVCLKSQHQELQDKFDNLVSSAVKEVDCIDFNRQGHPGTNTGLQCIKTVMLSSTSMLGPGPQRYCLHFTWESDTSLRTPSVYLRPGYKVHLRWDKGLLHRARPTPVYSTHADTGTYSLILEKSEKDDSLPWPIPNDMEIGIVAEPNSSFAQKLPPVQQQSLCNRCNPRVNLSRVGARGMKHAISTWKQDGRSIDNPNGFYAHVTLVNHHCAHNPSKLTSYEEDDYEEW